MSRATDVSNQWTSSIASASLVQFKPNTSDAYVKRLVDLEKALENKAKYIRSFGADRPILGATKANITHHSTSPTSSPPMLSTNEIVHEEDDDDDDDDEGNDDNDDDTRVIDDDQSDMIVDNGGILEESSDDNEGDT